MLPASTKDLFLAGNVQVPWKVWTTPPTAFDPTQFILQPPEFSKEFLVSQSRQEKSLRAFLENPTAPHIYGVSSQPDDSQAIQFAAYLLRAFLRASTGRACWVQLHERDTDLIKEQRSLSLLIISGLYPTMSQWRIERVKDLIDYYDTIPRIVVMTGEDPMTFMLKRLYQKPTALYFKGSPLTAKSTESV